MRFKGFDLNLLVALDALLREQSVSRAAGRLNLTQPAASAALSRLRSHFQDDILISSGKTMIPTAHAKNIEPLLRDLFTSLEQLVDISHSFDPATSHRRFRIAASDYTSTVLLTPLLPRIEREAPGVGFEIMLAGPTTGATLQQGDVDLVLNPENFTSPDHPVELLFEERHVVVGWSGNPVFDEAMTEEVFFRSGHVAVELDAARTFFEERLLALGRARRVEVQVASFLAAPLMIPGTMRLTVMQERLARLLVDYLPLKAAPLPFAIPPMRMMAQHHRTRSVDSGLQWLLGHIHQQIAAEAPA